MDTGFSGGSDRKKSACNAGDTSSIPGLRRCPGEGNGNPLQYSCLENLMDRGAWRATVHGFAKSRTPRKHIEHRALQKNKRKKQEKTHKSQMKTVLWHVSTIWL